LLDATVVSEPGKTGSQWRIHYSLRLPHWSAIILFLLQRKALALLNDLPNSNFKPRPGFGDAGYSHQLGIQSVVEQNAAVCVRLNPYALPLYDKAGGRIDLTARLSGLARPER